MVDWPKILDSYGVPYVTSGPNVASGNINVRCPMCGADDPSEHMGINLRGKGWACWRNPQHRGKSPAHLIVALIGCSLDQAHQIVGTDTVIAPENFMQRINGLLRPHDQLERTPPILPAEFKKFPIYNYASAPFYNYLNRRGFSDARISRFTEEYDIFYCRKGAYRNRVIFTVYHEQQLVGWTGRTIANHIPRYKTLSPDIEKATMEGYMPAAKRLTDYLLWFDDLVQCDDFALYICEGPFDALKVRELGRGKGRTATCLFTSAISEVQTDLLHRVLQRFERKYLLLDRNMEARSLRLASQLLALGVEPLHLPPSVDDPGELKSLSQLIQT